MTARELCDAIGTDKRTVAAMIQRRRRAGVPICAARSGRPGYFIALTAEEMRDYCGKLKHEEAELRKTRRACERLIEALPER